MFQLTPQLLKQAITAGLVDLIKPIREAYESNQEWQDIALKAYPPPPKKVKKVKDKGSRYPAGAPPPAKDGDAAQPEEKKEQDLPIR